MKFGQYELLERVAVGGMAEVYRGRVAGAEGFEKWVAIKRILPEFAKDDRFISMMLTEARIHSALSHRNIVQIHDLGISEDGEYFIVLEYVEGHDLRAVMETASELGVQIPDALALHIAGELAQALHFAHELRDPDGRPLGIIHRDVSPSNVLISNSGEVKLSDFGIAKRRHEHSVVGSLKGNLVYMSPEQARRASLDRRTDVFSLGAVLFEMLTGQKIREITDEVDGSPEVASGVVRSPRLLRPDLPDAYDALLLRALALDPARRFPDAAAFGAAVRELRRESEAPVGPADMKELLELLSPPRRARSPVERSKIIRLGPEFRFLAGAPKGAKGATGGDVPPSATGFEPPPSRAPGVVPPPPKPHARAGSNGNASAHRGASWADTGARLAAPTPPATPASTPPAFSDDAVTPPPPAAPKTKSNPQPAAVLSVDLSRDLDPPTAPPAPAVGRVVLAASADAPREMIGAEPDPQIAESAMYSPTPLPVALRTSQAPSTTTMATSSVPSDLVPITPAPGPGAPARFTLPIVPAGASVGSAPVMSLPKRRGGHALSFAVALLSVLGVGAAVIHYKIVSLDVLLTWRRPATLAISSDPAGAEIRLDGRALAEETPARVEVRRDFQDHVLELSHPGTRSVRKLVRFDRSVDLSEEVSLPRLPPEAPPVAVEAAAPSPPPEPVKVAGAEPTRTGTKAEIRAARKAAKAAARQAKKKSKRRKNRKTATKRGGESTETADL